MFDLYTIYDNYELILYTLQHKVYNLISLEINSLTPAILILLFLSGVLTSITPCFMSVFPLTISYITSQNQNNTSKVYILLGLITSLILTVSSANLISYRYYSYINNIPILSSLILFFISLNLLQIIDMMSFFSRFNPTININYLGNSSLKSYFLGCLVGFSTVPCSSSIIIILTFWLSHSTNTLMSISYWTIYLLGCVLPFIVITNIAINYIQSYTISYVWELIVPLSGSFVLSISLFSFLEKMFI